MRENTVDYEENCFFRLECIRRVISDHVGDFLRRGNWEGRGNNFGLCAGGAGRNFGPCAGEEGRPYRKRGRGVPVSGSAQGSPKSHYAAAGDPLYTLPRTCCFHL